jgi:3-deoxy-D-manno-octulosonic acid kinase
MIDRSLRSAVTALDAAATASAARAFSRGERAGARAFLWRPIVAAVAAVGARSPDGRAQGPVFAGFGQVLHAAKLMEADLHWREETAVACTIGARRCLVRRGWRGAMTAILEGGAEAELLAGGRGGVLRYRTEQGNVILRRYRRGGAIRWLGTLYAGRRWRPFREFWILETARRCGLPVVEPIAAVVEPLAPGVYRGLLATFEVGGARPIHRAVESGGAAWVEPLAAALRRIHDAGLRHDDLNLGNVLVSGAGEIVFVDLDRGAFLGEPIPRVARSAALARLRRSARKLDPASRILPDVELDRLEERYWGDGHA